MGGRRCTRVSVEVSTNLVFLVGVDGEISSDGADVGVCRVGESEGAVAGRVCVGSLGPSSSILMVIPQ